MDHRLAERIQRDRVVLVVIDPQERLAAVMPDRERVLDRIARLVRLAGIVRAPVIVTRQYPKGLGELEPTVLGSLQDARADGSDVTVLDKLAFCACGEETFVSALESTGRDQVLVVGMETHICVAQTALELLARGFGVQVAADACCSRGEQAHDLALARVREAGAVVTVAESAMYEAVPVAGTPEFKRLLSLVKDA